MAPDQNDLFFSFAKVYFGAGTFDSQRSSGLCCTCLLLILNVGYSYLFSHLNFRKWLVQMR